MFLSQQSSLAHFEDATTGFVIVARDGQYVAVDRAIHDDFLSGLHGFERL